MLPGAETLFPLELNRHVVGFGYLTLLCGGHAEVPPSAESPTVESSTSLLLGTIVGLVALLSFPNPRQGSNLRNLFGKQALYH